MVAGKVGQMVLWMALQQLDDLASLLVVLLDGQLAEVTDNIEVEMSAISMVRMQAAYSADWMEMSWVVRMVHLSVSAWVRQSG